MHTDQLRQYGSEVEKADSKGRGGGRRERIVSTHILRFRPNLVQVPCGLGRTDTVIAALDDDSRNVADLVDVLALEELAVLHEAVVDKVVGLCERRQSREVGAA